MTHFNHDWTNDIVAVPQAVGDRYYAQDLNDDFNYLKHLPYEAILQGRTKGVMIPPTDTWDADSHTLSLSGGFGVVALDTPVLDVNEDFTIPPKTISVSRFERIAFSNATLVLPNDTNIHYIVATPIKRSLLQRGKALLSEQYACRVKYDGVIIVQDTAPTANQILIGLCYDDEYLLCKDFVLDQGVNTIKLHKWYGEHKITKDAIALLQLYYNITIETIETNVYIGEVSISTSIKNFTFKNSTISIDNTRYNQIAIRGGTFENCTISIGTINASSYGFYEYCVLKNCTISIGIIDMGYGSYAYGDMINFENCIISIGTIKGSVYDQGYGVYSGTFEHCTFFINTIESYGTNFNNSSSVKMYFVHARAPSVPSLASVIGKGFVINDTTVKGF